MMKNEDVIAPLLAELLKILILRDQSQPGSLFQGLREAEKRDPGNEVAQSDVKSQKN